MKLSTFNTVIPVLVALPALTTTSPLEPRATDGVYICTDKHWNGDCVWVETEDAEPLCRVFDYKQSRYLSFGPDSGVKCIVYTNLNCNVVNPQDAATTIDYPGDYELRGPAYTDGPYAYRAYKCYPKSSKREINPDEEGTDNTGFYDSQTKAESKNLHLESRRHTSSGLLPSDNVDIPVRPTHAPPEDTPGVWVCSEPNWAGICTWKRVYIPIFCATLPLDWDELSFGPDEGVTCLLYANAECETVTIDSLQMTYPGYLRIAGPAYSGEGDHDREFAYSCWETPSKRDAENDNEDEEISHAAVTTREVSGVNYRIATPQKAGSTALVAAKSPPKSRATDGVLVCDEAEWEGRCEWTQVGTSQVCRDLPSEWGTWSLGPDVDVTCLLYANVDCSPEPDTSTTLTSWPGHGNLAGPSYPFKKRTASAACKAYACKKREAGDPEPESDNGVNAPKFQVPGVNARAVKPRGEGGLYIC